MMAVIAPAAASSADPQPLKAEAGHIDAPGLQGFVMALFFIFGGDHLAQ